MSEEFESSNDSGGEAATAAEAKRTAEERNKKILSVNAAYAAVFLNEYAPNTPEQARSRRRERLRRVRRASENVCAWKGYRGGLKSIR